MRGAIILAAALAPLVSAQTEKPVALYPGLGIWSHKIATANPEAQKYFNQGLSLLYGFNRYEAMRSFRKASELDPAAAMPYWGIAMSFGPYINQDIDPSFDMKESCAAVDKGLALRQIAAEERPWLEAAATRCPEYADPNRYIAAMRELAAKYPDDLDALTFYADSLMIPVRWHWYSGDEKPAPGVAEAEHTLEAVLRRLPTHPGANHLYIHAVESSLTPERAIPSSERLMGIVPAAGHMVHMPGHIWLAVGNYELAATVNERAAEVDRQYFAKTGVMGSYYPYYLHNLQFILYARSMQGLLAETRKAERDIEAAAEPMMHMMPPMVAMIDSAALMAELRNYRWDDVIAAAKPKMDDPITMVYWRFTRALAFAMKGRAEEARTEQAAFEKVRGGLDPKSPMGPSPKAMELASTILQARLAGSAAESAELFRKAVIIEDGLTYDEPPTWYYPVRESLGAALLKAGDAAGAQAVFREGIRRGPHNGRLLFGLMESLKAQGKPEAAAMVRREFDAAWKGTAIKLAVGDL